MREIKFISYDGKYPWLCMGTLTLEVDGSIVKMGYGTVISPFWSSGGYCLRKDDEEIIGHGEWLIDRNLMPNYFTEEEKELISDLFKSNVPKGCCGGCL